MFNGKTVVLILTEKDFRPNTNLSSPFEQYTNLLKSMRDVELADFVTVVDSQGNSYPMKTRNREAIYAIHELHFLIRPASFDFFGITFPN